MEPQQIFRSLRRRWRPILVLAALGAALGVASASVGEDADPLPVPVHRYQACHTLVVDSAIPGNVEQWDVRNLAQLGERLTQGEIPEAVATATSREVVEVTPRVRVIVRNDVQSVQTCTVDETPAAAEDLADEFAAQLVSFLERKATEFHTERVASAEERAAAAEERKQSIERQLATLLAANPDADTLALDQALAESSILLTSATSELVRFESSGVPVVPLETLEDAEAETISESTYEARLRTGAAGNNVVTGAGDDLAGNDGGSGRPGRSVVPTGPVSRGVAGGVGGLGLGLAFVIMSERLDSRLRSKSDVESVLDLPVIGEIPPLSRRDRRATRIVAAEEPRSRAAESYRALRSALEYARMVDIARGLAGEGAHVVLVTSAGPAEGKTTTIANLAAVMAEGERRVLAVNCDFRRPRLHRYLGGPAAPQRVNPTEVAGVELVTQVTPNDADATPSEVVAAQRRLVSRARDRFDVILLDSAPVLTTNDAAEVLAVTDDVILVVAAGQTTADAGERAAELLERRGHPPLGVAFVGARDVPNSSDYYYDDHDPYLRRASGRRRGDPGSPGRAREAPAEVR